MSRKQPKRTAGKVAPGALVGFFVLVVVACGIGMSVASADPTDELAQNGAFGYDKATTTATMTVGSNASEDTSMIDSGAGAAAIAGESLSEAGVPYGSEATVPDGFDPIEAASASSELVRTTSRDLSSGYQMIDDMEEAERQRIEHENAAVFDRIAATKAMNGVTTNISSNRSENTADTEYGMPAVDWTVGMEAFIDEWTMRIDTYLAGSALEGYGRTFAEAAWEYGVDPRFSPGISCVESGKGAVCFRSCNAWGWGKINWPDWDTAIRSHIQGLSEGYGYSVTMEGATLYNYETPVDWYNRVHEEMSKI